MNTSSHVPIMTTKTNKPTAPPIISPKVELVPPDESSLLAETSLLLPSSGYTEIVDFSYDSFDF